MGMESLSAISGMRKIEILQRPLAVFIEPRPALLPPYGYLGMLRERCVVLDRRTISINQAKQVANPIRLRFSILALDNATILVGRNTDDVAAKGVGVAASRQSLELNNSTIFREPL